MTVTPTGIQAAIESLGQGSSLPKGILESLASALTERESIYAAAQAVVTFDVDTNAGAFQQTTSVVDMWRPWSLVLTQKRVLFARNRVFGGAILEVLTLNKVRRIKMKGLIMKHVLIETTTQTLKLESGGTITFDASRFAERLGQLTFGGAPRQHSLGFYSEGLDEATANHRYSREPIPSEVQRYVWERDHGRCVKCNSAQDLQFDHIIPVSRGGNNSAANLQILCRSCNLSKSNRVGG